MSKNEIFLLCKSSPIAALLKSSLLQTSCPIITAAMFSTVKRCRNTCPKEAYKAVTDAIEKRNSHQQGNGRFNSKRHEKLGKIPERYPLHPLVQPLTDGTAEKHDGFIEFGEDGDVIERFPESCLSNRNRMLLLSPMAVSATHSRHADIRHGMFLHRLFVVDTTLCIPTIFISYTGEALDYKNTSAQGLAAVDKAATDVCQLFDKNIARVYTNLGWEQEYFLVDLALYNARPRLMPDRTYTHGALFCQRPAVGRPLFRFYPATCHCLYERTGNRVPQTGHSRQRRATTRLPPTSLSWPPSSRTPILPTTTTNWLWI